MGAVVSGMGSVKSVRGSGVSGRVSVESGRVSVESVRGSGASGKGSVESWSVRGAGAEEVRHGDSLVTHSISSCCL